MEDLLATGAFGRRLAKKHRTFIAAIERLHEQHKSGAMSNGNYEAMLWTLMDRIERRSP